MITYSGVEFHLLCLVARKYYSNKELHFVLFFLANRYQKQTNMGVKVTNGTATQVNFTLAPDGEFKLGE